MANIYKTFRSVTDIVDPAHFRLNKRFDEPTYFSFKLIFGQGNDTIYNYAGNRAYFDTMPHPLFNPVNAGEIFYNNSLSSTISLNQENSYSALSYLANANEPTRVEMLKEFIEKFNNLQTDYPYYFQSVDGVLDLLKIDTTKGQRILNDKKITITCLEGLDLRMSYLLNLYRKIVWDDIYQRWVLPDMMRYFTLRIYLAEFRTFHLPVTQTTSISKPYGNKGVLPETPIYLRILDDILPVWEIDCEMCEFDLSDIIFEHLNNLSVATEPNQGSVKFSVKVGNIKETQMYPVFQHMFLNDRKLNGVNRAKDEISTQGDEISGNFTYTTSLQIAQNRDANSARTQHISGMPYNERINENNLDEANIEEDKAGGTLGVNFDATKPNTWVGNAINFGASYAKGFVGKIIDKAKMTSVPGLGISFNEVRNVIGAKDIIGALGLIRKGINEVVNQYGNAPSSRLEQPIQTDNIMKEFLSVLSKSEATDEDTVALAQAANMALSERGVWEKIKDYSLATNLTATGEVNTRKTLQGTEQYQMNVAQQSKAATISKDIDVNATIPQVVSNAASGKNISSDSKIAQNTPSSDLSKSMSVQTIEMGTASSDLDSKIKSNIVSEEAASSKLTSNIESDSVNRGAASGNLSKNIQSDSIKRGIASSNLSSKEIEKNTNEIAGASSRLSSKTENAGMNNVQGASSELTGAIPERIIQSPASANLSSQISNNTISGNVKKTTSIDINIAMQQTSPNAASKTINAAQIIEGEPSRILNTKMNTETLKQPVIGKAMTNKIEEQKIEEITNSKATTNKLEQTDVLKIDEKSQATNSELFSK
jgi:hypothetical protein